MKISFGYVIVVDGPFWILPTSSFSYPRSLDAAF